MKPSLLDPLFRYIPASDHADPFAFRRRQRARMAAAKTIIEAAKANVRTITTKRKA